MNNLKIAQVHSSNRKLVAYCVAKASFLALIVNTFVVPAGLVCIVLMLNLVWYANILPILFLIPIGALLAIAVDGMTMGSCARLRRSFEKRIEIKNHYASVEKIEPDVVDEAEKRELDALKPSYIMNGMFIGIFTVISVGAGELFWHQLLESLPTWLSWGLSSLFSIAVSVTLIASELLKSQNEEVIAESIDAVKFHKKAVQADTQEKAITILHGEYINQVEDLKNNTPMISTTVKENVTSIYNDLFFDGENVIQQRIEADNIARERAEQKRLDRVRQQRELLTSKTVSSEDERHTGPIESIPSPKFRKLGNAEKVQTLVDKYGEPYVRRNIDAMSAEIGMHKTTIYSHLKALKEG